MDPKQYLETIHLAEGLKNELRHCYTSTGRHESVAEHSWRITLMAYFLKDEFPEADMDKVICMCIIHDLGEIFTGDIPSFLKTGTDEAAEDAVLSRWVRSLPDPYRTEMTSLYQEMRERTTLEAKLFKAMDSLEALISHNESDLNTWSENEFSLNLTYADDKVEFSDYLKQVRELVRQETIEKIKTEPK